MGSCVSVQASFAVLLSQSRSPCRMHRLGPISDLKLREDVGDVVSHRLWAQDEVGGDVGIGLALGNQGEDLVFAHRQFWKELRGSTLRAWSCRAEIS